MPANFRITEIEQSSSRESTLRTTLLCVLLLFICLFFAYALADCSPSEPRGLLLGTRTRSLFTTDLATGTKSVAVVPDQLRNPLLLCLTSNGSSIVKFDGPLRTHVDSIYLPYFDSLYQFDWRGLKLSPFHPRNRPKYIQCQSLDYDSSHSSFLFSGRYDSVNGFFILDSTFAISADLRQYTGALKIEECGDGFFVINGVVLNARREIWYVNLVTKKVEYVTEGRVEARSPDGKSFVYKDNDESRYYIYDLVRMERLEISANIGDGVTDWAFSPDGKYLAWVQREGFPEVSPVRLYEIDSGRIIETKVSAIWGFFWVQP